MAVLDYIINLGASVMLPIIIFVFALVVRTKPSKAFRAALTVGIGFIAINLIIGLLSNSLGPATKEIIDRFGIELSVIDVGWPAASAISFGAAVGSLAIPIGIGVNVLMLLFGLTRTLDIDLWNYWHIAFTGALVTIITGSFTLGVYTSVVHMIVLLVLADLTAHHIEKYYGYKNISFPHGTSAPYYLIALPFEKLFNAIPGVRNIKADPDAIQKRFGVFGEPSVLGLILGVIIGILAGFSLSEILQLGVKTAAVMYLLPRMVKILMEGLMPISEAAGKMIKKRFPGRDFNIGMDSAIAVGHPTVISSALILIPITLLLAVILPGNKVLPFADLVGIPFIICMMVPVFRGNVFRTVVAGAIAIGGGLYIASYIAPVFTKAATNAGFQLPEGATQISSLIDGIIPTTILFIWAGKLGYIGLTVLGLIFLAVGYWQKRKHQLAKNASEANPQAAEAAKE
ncbi:MAG TPA: PTS transporter subunit IIC [Bacillales bacterium]|nr:PTS transporter subunit IIC [Bacillales bacterium]